MICSIKGDNQWIMLANDGLLMILKNLQIVVDDDECIIKPLILSPNFNVLGVSHTFGGTPDNPEIMNSFRRKPTHCVPGSWYVTYLLAMF